MSWHAVFGFLAQNKVVFGLLVTAGIATMPEPGTSVSWMTFYKWLYDWAHLFPNLRRPTTPANPPAKP